MMAKSHDWILCIIYTSPYYRHVSEAEVREVRGGTPIEPSVAFNAAKTLLLVAVRI
jgi:hypothetical protein